MDLVVILEPPFDSRQNRAGIRQRVDPDIVAFEGFDEGFCDAVALRALDRSEAGREIKRDSHIDGVGRSVDRAIVRQPLHGFRGAECSKPRFDTLDHQIADHLAADTCRGGDPADGFAIMAIQHESDAHHLSVPAGELHAIRTQTYVGASNCDATVMPAWSPAACMTFEQEAMLLHQPINALGIDHVASRDPSRSSDEGGNPPVAVARSLIDQCSDFCSEVSITFAVLRTSCLVGPGQALGDVGTGNAEHIGNGLHREMSGSTEVDRKLSFFERDRSRAYLRISTSRVLRPS